MTTPLDLHARVPLHDGRHPERFGGERAGRRPATPRTILVAESDSTYRLALRRFLEQSGYQVIEADNMATSLRAVFRQEADLVVLDLDRDGGTADVLTKIRRRSTVPVIVCSGQASEHDRVRLLNLGADDFVVKPYSMAELEARVPRRDAPRQRHADAPRWTSGDLVIDRGTRTVTIGEAEVDHDAQGIRPAGLPGHVPRAACSPARSSSNGCGARPAAGRVARP